MHGMVEGTTDARLAKQHSRMLEQLQPPKRPFDDDPEASEPPRRFTTRSKSRSPGRPQTSGAASSWSGPYRRLARALHAAAAGAAVQTPMMYEEAKRKTKKAKKDPPR